MGRYTVETTATCVETKKHLKESIKKEKTKLKDFIELSNHVDMNWEHRYQTIGSIYLNIVNMKDRLKGK